MKRPTKADLEKLESLLLAGYSKTDIAKALDTTRPTIDRWIGRCDPEVVARAKEERGGSWAKISRKTRMPELTPRDHQVSRYVFPVELDPLNELTKLNKQAWAIYNTAEKNEEKIKALAEIRQQVQTAMSVVKQIYDMKAAKEFMALVLEEVNKADPEVATRIRQRLQDFIAGGATAGKATG